MDMSSLHPLRWLGSAKKDYGKFPEVAQELFGFELYLAQLGEHPPSAKPLTGFGGGILELVRQFDGDAYRAVYTVRFEEAVYVLHAFKKKSKRGIATPAGDVALIRRRFADAVADIEERRRSHEAQGKG
jgi:phage-related protein